MHLRAAIPALAGAMLALAVFALALQGSSPAASALANCDTTEAGLTAAEEEFLAAVNAERATLGRAPLQTTEALNRAAAWKSADQLSVGGLSHTDSLGRDMEPRFLDCGVPPGYTGEITLVGARTGTQAFTLFKSSPPHYSAMIDPSYRFIGVGQAGLYWTATLSSTGGSSTPPTPGGGTAATATATPTRTPTATPTATPTPPLPTAGVQLQLYAGCNLVTYSGPPLAAAAALRSLGSALIDAYRWVPLGTPQWQRWAPGVPAYALEFTTFEPGEVYCIRLSAGASWSY